eukprot:SAG22_NODE_445_length_10447_cov_4.063104_1_plen_59_part_10
MILLDPYVSPWWCPAEYFFGRLTYAGMRLAVYPDVPRGSPVRPILDSTLAHAERCLIFR